MLRLNNKMIDLSPTIYIICGIIVLVLIVLLIFILKLSKNKKKNIIKIDTEFMNNLIYLLGEKENIKDVEVVNTRLKIDLHDVKKANLEELHKKSTKGVFVTNNSLKMIFDYESNDILKELKRRIG